VDHRFSDSSCSQGQDSFGEQDEADGLQGVHSPPSHGCRSGALMQITRSFLPGAALSDANLASIGSPVWHYSPCQADLSRVSIAQARSTGPQHCVPIVPGRRKRAGGVAFCDLPQVPPGPSGKFVIAIMAAVAELEAGLISERTKAALAKARGGQARQPEASARYTRAGPAGGSGETAPGRQSRGAGAALH
jgi:resolvase-like protein